MGQIKEGGARWPCLLVQCVVAQPKGGPGRSCTAEVRRSSELHGHVRRSATWSKGARRGGSGLGEAGEGCAAAQGTSSTWRASRRAAARRAAVRYGGARRSRAGAGLKAGLTGGQTALGCGRAGQTALRGRSDRPPGLQPGRGKGGRRGLEGEGEEVSRGMVEELPILGIKTNNNSRRKANR